ncbi:hypothetical protein HYC85_018933 [Camellia sinensis]|uniref:AAA+ ATPase domain-containing protein n=1 Tax=Camellia sinensis TaxID=4442 RepID=A0A7J7GZF1_CAMSI|nr:hypothetical protein HYC85_018933 [Camellia sinensis]
MEILSQMWSLLGLLTLLQNILPSQLLSLLNSFYESLQDFLTPYSYFEIPEFNDHSTLDPNDLYRHVNLYLNSIITATTTTTTTCRRLALSLSKSSTCISFTIPPNHTLPDSFLGHQLSWTHHVDTVQDSLDEKRNFTLKIPKRHHLSLLLPYLRHVSSRAEEFERGSRERRLFTNNGHQWVSVPFRHPSNFNTLALEPDLKTQITEDLRVFSQGKDFYHRIGRAWKRGYLLHGAPGTGKSSLIAAMANFLCYDVYDLELTKVSDNSELRSLLVQTTNRSIIVIEDIDCSLDLTGDRLLNRTRCVDGDCDDNPRVTLSGLLNFTDGLWSCCGEERIIVFTTNHRGNVDPALIRCGRMDVHVSLGTCGVHAFKALVMNYLGVESHAMFDVAESCIRSGGALTPAQIGEILLRNRRDADVAIKAVISAMQAKILGADVDFNNSRHEYDDVAGKTVESGDRKVMVLSPENWEDSEWRLGGKKKKNEGSTWERKVKFLVRLKSLTKSDSGRRGV